MTTTLHYTTRQLPGLSGARMKGSHVRLFLTWYTDQGGQQRTGRLIDRVRAPHQNLFDWRSPDLGILDSVWYPAESIHGLVDGLLEGTTAEQRTALAREGARVAMHGTLHGVYRWLFEKMMTPDRYLAKAQMLFSRFNDPGTLVKVATAPNTHLSIVRGWTGHHPYLCELLFYSGIAVYEAMGCRNVQGERLACVSDGAEECRYTTRWDD